jgi:hypothetical protein
MTVVLEQSVSFEDRHQRSLDVIREAIGEYFAGLAKIADVSEITPVNDDPDFDFLIRVPDEHLFDVGERLVELSFSVLERYGVKFATLPVGILKQN